jgi:hypothetical protein
MGNTAKSSIANSMNAKTCSFEWSREPSSTAVKIAALSEIVPLNLKKCGHVQRQSVDGQDERE